MKSPNDKTLISILGPTAVGKTQLSIRLAKALNTSILSADSRQFYEEMEIGTAKPSDLELASVPHFFINSLSVNQDFNVSDFEKEALKTIESILNEKDNVIMVGGNGLYHHAIWYGFDTNLPGSDANLRKELKLLFENKGIESLREKLREIDSNSLDVIDQNNAVRLM